MNKIVIIAVALLVTCSLSAQKVAMNSRKVDFNEIKNTIQNKLSPLFWNTLFKRYKDSDSTLTANDYWYLYYGYSFQKEYIPYNSIEKSDLLDKFTTKKDISQDDYKKIVQISEKELNRMPFNLDLLWMLYASYSELGMEKESRAAFTKFSFIIDAIISSGNGMSEESAFVVLTVEDEQMMLTVLGFDYVGEQSLTDSYCDKLTVKANEQEITHVYFNVSRLFEVNLGRTKGGK